MRNNARGNYRDAISRFRRGFHRPPESRAADRGRGYEIGDIRLAADEGRGLIARRLQLYLRGTREARAEPASRAHLHLVRRHNEAPAGFALGARLEVHADVGRRPGGGFTAFFGGSGFCSAGGESYGLMDRSRTLSLCARTSFVINWF